MGLTEKSKKYTSYVTPYGLFDYNQFPFGIASGSLVLTRLINQIFGPVLYKHVLAYFYDICVFTSGSLEEHLEHLKDTILRIQEAGLTINPGKTTIALDKMQFLGHMFCNGTILIDNEVVQPILKFLAPKSVKQVQRFIGMPAFHAKFLKGYVQISRPLNVLKRKGVEFTWGPDQQQAFEQLKGALASSPVLKMPDFEWTFVLQTDASGSGLGAQLTQKYGDDLLPVAYASRLLNKHELNRPTMELEGLSIVFGFKKCQQYLEHRPFVIQCDNSPLTHILNHPRQVGKIAR